MEDYGYDFSFEEANWTPSDELDWDGYEDEYSSNHCFPFED